MDMGEILMLAGMMALILGVVTAIYWYTRKVYRGFGFWVLANLSVGLGFILLGLRTQVPDFLSVIVGNTLSIYGIVLIYEGIQAFFERRTFDLPNHLLLAVCILLEFVYTYWKPDTNARIVMSSAVLGILDLRVAYTLSRHSPARLRHTSSAVGLIFILAALFVVGRGIYALLRTTPIDVLSDQTLFVETMGAACAMTIWTFYFLYLNSARVELDLEDASRKLAASADDSRREVEQLALLEEVGQIISGSLDEAEILQSTVKTVVSRYGYAEVAVSMPVDGDMLEVMAIDGSEDIGYHRGYRQKLGEGIIGHAGQSGQIYVSGDVEHDPYYFTVGRRSGSAVAVPMLNEDRLFGVLYVESAAKDAFQPSDVSTLRTIVSHLVTAINKARLYASTQDHLVVMTTLHSISQIITSSLELPRIFQTVLELLKDTFGYSHISIYLLDKDILRLGAQIGYPESLVLAEIPVSRGIVGRTVQSKQLQFIRDVNSDPAFLRAAFEVQFEVCVPLFKKGNVLGVINVEEAPGRPLTDRDADVLTALAGPIAIAIDNAQLHAQATSLARTDGLTGLMNRRTFDETFEAEIERAARYEYPLTLIILDIDDFKTCNDTWGHPAGDTLLKAAACLIRANIRTSDTAARYGGDEFAVILPNTSQVEAVELAERLRQAAHHLTLEPDARHELAGNYTISVGVASYPTNGCTAEDLLIAADHAELAAKRLGKDRVQSAS